MGKYGWPNKDLKLGEGELHTTVSKRKIFQYNNIAISALRLICIRQAPNDSPAKNLQSSFSFYPLVVAL